MDDNSALEKLHDLSSVATMSGSLDQNVSQLAATAAKILNADDCSIMLLDEGESGPLKLKVFATTGELPASAFSEGTEVSKSIAGQVVTSGQGLLIKNIERSDFACLARGGAYRGKSFISSPVAINANIIGAINVSSPRNRRAFTLDDLNMLDIVALFVGKSIQVMQLEGVLNSRFAQMALFQEAERTIDNALAGASANPTQMARILAKSFFREMTRAGFGSNQIISAASEIISQLSSSLRKHSKWLDRR